MGSEEATRFRVWFCTVCNNQSRVTEELGDDLYQSPFAQVLRSSSCSQVALVSPFLALNRKWCDYEFCVAREQQKVVMLLTEDGPKMATLHDVFHSAILDAHRLLTQAVDHIQTHSKRQKA